MHRVTPRFIRPVLSFICDTPMLCRLLTGYRISRQKCKNVARIDLNIWMVYSGAREYINHGYSMEVDFLRLKIVMLDERVKDCVYDGVTLNDE